MNITPPQGEVRPHATFDSPFSGPTVPLLRLRQRGREPISPEACLLGPRCLVCRWRRAGLLDPPADADDLAEAA